MIMYMFKLLCVTSRSLCRDNFTLRIQKLLESGADAVILREKTLTETAYTRLAADLLTLPGASDRLVMHHFPETAGKLGASSLHLSLYQLEARPTLPDCVSTLGISVHSAAEAARAEALGASYITAGHIFDTACKQGLPGRGLFFLEEICRTVTIPVYAIGGIAADNIRSVLQAGASGACIMSTCMTCPRPEILLETLRSKLS